MKSSSKVPIVPIQRSESTLSNVRDYLASRMQDAIQGYVFINALFTFVESKLYPELQAEGSLDARAAAARHGYDEGQVIGLLRYLATQDLFRERGRFFPTPYCAAVLSSPAVGRLRLYRGGYGELFHNAGRLLDGSAKYGQDLVRHGGFVGTASNAITSAFFNEVPLRVLGELQVRSIADLGCGSGAFVMEFVSGGAERRGTGIDIDALAIAAGRERVQQAGLGERVELVAADCFDLEVLRRHAGSAQVLFAHGMEHELLRDGEQAVLSHIGQMARLFPGKSFLMGEPMLGRSREQGQFYWAHILSMQGMPLELPGWIDLLSRLEGAHLEKVFRTEDEQGVAFFLIRFAE